MHMVLHQYERKNYVRRKHETRDNLSFLVKGAKTTEKLFYTAGFRISKHSSL